MKTTTKSLIILYMFLMYMALSSGSVIYWLPVIFFTFLLSFSFLSAFLAKNNMEINQHICQKLVTRGETVDITLNIKTGTFLPIAPIKIFMHDSLGDTVNFELGGKTTHSYPFTAMHVGKYFPGMDYCEVSDIFGLFSFKVFRDISGEPLYVTPRIFDIESLKFGVGDMGAETIKRAMEDITSPSGIRKYQIGDPLKKIHWKLSLRKNELMVRQYDEPTFPSTFVLMDVSHPHVSQNASAQRLACLKDGVLETAASMAISQMKMENKVKLPIMGSQPFLFTSSMGEHVLLEKLSSVAFDEGEEFERFIMLEMQNLRQAGAIVAITTRLSSNLAELLSQIAMKGPAVRIYLVTYAAQSPTLQPMIERLQSRKVEVCYVIP